MQNTITYHGKLHTMLYCAKTTMIFWGSTFYTNVQCTTKHAVHCTKSPYCHKIPWWYFFWYGRTKPSL